MGEGVGGAGVTFDEALHKYDRMCWRIAGSAWQAYTRIHDLDDLHQVAIIGLWQAWKRCTNTATFAAFAKHVVTQSVACHIRQVDNGMIRTPSTHMRKGARVVRVALFDEEEERASAEDVTASLDVADALQRLPAVQAEALRLVYMDGWNAEELARASGVSVNTLRYRLKAGKQTFRRLWQQEVS